MEDIQECACRPYAVSDDNALSKAKVPREGLVFAGNVDPQLFDLLISEQKKNRELGREAGKARQLLITVYWLTVLSPLIAA